MVRYVAVSFHFLIPMFYFCLSTTVVSSVAINVEETVMSTATVFHPKEMIMIGMMVLFGFLSQVFMSASTKLEKAGRLSTVRYIQVVLAFAADVFIFNTSYHWNEILGVVLIVCTSLAFIVMKYIWNR